jgi:hypothetical protein
MPQVGKTSTIVLNPTLAGVAGSFEGDPVVTLTPAEAGNVTGLDVAWLLEGSVNISVSVDNLQGADVGVLTGSVDVVVDPVPAVVLADTLGVSLADNP